MRKPRTRRLITAGMFAAAAAVVAVPTVSSWFASGHDDPTVPVPTLSASGPIAPPVDPLAGITITPETPATGFNRARLFGTWSRSGGCTTRDRVLAAQLEHVTYQPGTCKVTGGTLHDPYTGLDVPFTGIDIDHLVPEEEACQSGACGPGWDRARRRAFANDPAELVAVAASVNRAKGDRDPAEWLPPNTADRCVYAAGYVAVKKKWHLSVDPAEAAALERLLNACD